MTDGGSAGQNWRATICCIHGFILGSLSMIVMIALLPATLILGEGMWKGRRVLGEFGQRIQQKKRRAKEYGIPRGVTPKPDVGLIMGKERSFSIV